MPKTLSLVALALLVSACSAHGPVSPTPPPAPAPPPVVVVPNDPTPPPVPPTPPLPVPPPPKPEPLLYLDATATSAHWFRDPLPATFIIELWPDAVWLGNTLRVPRIGDPHDGTVIAKDADGLFTMHPGATPGTWVWDYTGGRGSAMGEAVQR